MTKTNTAVTKTLEFKKGVTAIDLPTLDRTTKFDEVQGLSKQKPVQHTAFIKELAQLCDDNKIVHNIDPIYASEKQALILNYQGDREKCPVENFLIQRLVTKIQLVHPDDKGQNMNIGISYNEKGISVCMGVNIHVCSNQNIFGGNLLHTYGRDRVSYDEMLLKISAWLSGYEGMRNENFEIVQKMRDIEISMQQVQQIIGELFSLSVQANNGGTTSPLSQVQVADLVRASHEDKYKLPKGQKPSIWDITQWGTNGLKAETTDLLTLQDTNQRFNNFMFDTYCKN